MHPLVTQLSMIAALLVLLQQLWSTASIGHTLVVSAMTGLAAYGVLFAGQLTLRYVLTPSESASEEPPATPSAGDDPTPPPSATS